MENFSGTFGKETVSSASIPDKIEDLPAGEAGVPYSYLNEILACLSCSKNYNITKNELSFYKKEKIPFPRKCPNCRYKRRFDLRPKRELWHRKCMCDKKHLHHTGGCPIEFETCYPPEFAGKVYCE